MSDERVPIRVSAENAEVLRALAKEREIELGEAADVLLSMGEARRKALAKYAGAKEPKPKKERKVREPKAKKERKSPLAKRSRGGAGRKVARLRRKRAARGEVKTAKKAAARRSGGRSKRAAGKPAGRAGRTARAGKRKPKRAQRAKK